jgi:hypothetical protein
MNKMIGVITCVAAAALAISACSDNKTAEESKAARPRLLVVQMQKRQSNNKFSNN